jgi:acyl-CoA thioesterase FadM
MYPFLKLTATFIKAIFRSELNLEDKSVLRLRTGFTDIDMFMELNNARYFNYMELGRWDFAYRVGFIRLMKKHKWGIALGGASVRFRRRIPFLSKFTLTTQLICHDGRWFYFLQETHRKNKICSSALMKLGVTSKNGLVPATDVLNNIDREDWGADVPNWVSAWVEAEGQRPWPTE